MNAKYLIAAITAFSALSSVAYAADTSQQDPTVAERLATAHKALAAKDFSLAMNELNKAMREEPRNAEVHNLIGYTYRVRANPDLPKSFEHYNLALKYNPDHKGTHEYIGEAYLMDKKPEEAEKHLAKLESICGNKTCPEYQELANAITVYKSKVAKN
jgi:Flp pilus assembly protein TadD